jgi:hypothetical protein
VKCKCPHYRMSFHNANTCAECMEFILKGCEERRIAKQSAHSGEAGNPQPELRAATQQGEREGERTRLQLCQRVSRTRVYVILLDLLLLVAVILI